MERLHQVTRAGALFFVLQGAIAADYCSLAVRVLSPDARRPIEIPVSIRERSGRVVTKETTKEDLEFCDLGISPVTVTVGNDTCNQVVVRDVPMEWNEEYLLAVTYDPEPCMLERPPAPVPVCQVLLRISDVNGNWLEKASVRLEGQQLSPLETDSAGRALVLLKSGDHVRGEVSATGYVSKSSSLSCSRAQPIQEHLIRLEKSSGH